MDAAFTQNTTNKVRGTDSEVWGKNKVEVNKPKGCDGRTGTGFSSAQPKSSAVWASWLPANIA